MNTFMQLLISGGAVGSVYGLVALGFLVIYRTTGVVNFAQGEMLMAGAVTAGLLLTSLGWPYPAVAAGVVAAAAVLLVLFRFGLYEVLRRRGAPLYSMVVATIAFGVALTEGASLVVGNARTGVPALLAGPPVVVGGVVIVRQAILIVAVTCLLVAAVWYFTNRTLTGLSLQAIGINHVAAEVSGIRVRRIVTIGLAISIVVTAMAGMLIAPIIGAGPYMGLPLAVKGFGAAVLGGMASVYRGMVAGLAIGVLETTSAYYVSSAYAPVIAYSILLVALVLLPARVRQGGHA